MGNVPSIPVREILVYEELNIIFVEFVYALLPYIWSMYKGIRY